ncbi:MAG: Crp/Fnr family transcriptional regulator [Clostridia bacterium]|nr:Crp/Fnr family transcriptional regulator [Clostridia bacterium]
MSYLKKIPIFSHLTEEELKKVDEITKVRKYRKNMIIFIEGEYGNELYFIKKGSVKISKLLEDGSEKILHFLKEGDIFAEVLLLGGGEYPATAEAIEDAEIGIIENELLEELLRKNGEITLKILKVMAERLRRAQYHIRDLALRDAYGRLTSVLLDLGEEYGEKTQRGVKISLKLSQQQLANLVGTSRETVARILGVWRKEGIIKVNNQFIEILDINRLKKWL